MIYCAGGCQEEENAGPIAPLALEGIATKPTNRLILKPKSPGRGRLATIEPGDPIGARRVRHAREAGGIEVRELPPGASLQDAIAHYNRSGAYEYVEPDHHITPSASPNDPHYADGSQWNLHNTGQGGGLADADIDAPEAWDTRTDASAVIVMVADSGLRYTHEDLAGNLWRNPEEVEGNGLDDDGNGYIDDVFGINAITGSGDPREDYPLGHGTHVAGIIGAVGNNGKGISGIAWTARLMPCRIFDENGSGNISSAVVCLAYARAQGAKVVNMSFSGPYSYALRDAIEEARAHGIIVVAAAGNASLNTDALLTYPAGYDLDNVLAVGASDRTDSLAFYSNFGAASVDLLAPGSEILSTHNASDSAYQVLSGTSMAAPHVTGALAMLWAETPADSYSQIINRLFRRVDTRAAFAGTTRTGGRLNLGRAIAPDGFRPINNPFSGRLSYPAGACLVHGSNVDATKEDGEPLHAGIKGGRSVWWTWKAPSAARVTLNTTRSGFDTLLGVYTGTSVGALKSVASNDNDGALTTSRVSFVPTSGTSYQIAVDGKAGAVGEVTLSVLQATAGGYSLTDIGDAANTYGASVANAINEAGQVTGWFERPGEVRTAFRQASAGTVALLPTLGGTHASGNAINGAGDVAGSSQLAGNTNVNPVLWKSDGSLVDLGRLPGWNNCAAHSVNDSLQVVGECFQVSEDLNPRAFLWQGGVMTDLGATDNGFSSARVITGGGRIFGKSTIAGNKGTFRAVEWVDGAVVELTDSPSEVIDANEAGQAVGAMQVGFSIHPALFDAGNAIDLAPEGGFGTAFAINARGEVVGTSGDTAVVFRNGAATTLNGLVAWDTCGGNLYAAYDISDGGQIVGQLLRLGVPHAYLIRPIPKTLGARADTYVRDGSSASQNFGRNAALQVKKASSAGNNRWAYLKFDTSGTPSLSAAKLRLFGAASTTNPGSLIAQVFAVANTGWSETGMTWNNKPATGSTVLASQTIANSTAPEWYEFDVGAFVRAEKLAGRHVISLAIKGEVVSDPYMKFNSRESSSQRPELVLTP